jgi:hypothetical protein
MRQHRHGSSSHLNSRLSPKPNLASLGNRRSALGMRTRDHSSRVSPAYKPPSQSSTQKKSLMSTCTHHLRPSVKSSNLRTGRNGVSELPCFRGIHSRHSGNARHLQRVTRQRPSTTQNPRNSVQTIYHFAHAETDPGPVVPPVVHRQCVRVSLCATLGHAVSRP